MGFGANVPFGGTSGKYQTTSLGFQAGLGRNLSPRIGVQLEYDANFFGIPDSILSTYCSTCSSGDVIIQSISFDPYFNLNPKGRTGLYFIGGGGYYWKETRFLVPSGQQLCTPTLGCVPTQSVASSWTNGAFGFNGGGGVTWRLGSASHLKLFVEGRYVFIDNQAGGGSSASTYPPAKYRTSYAPLMMGIRF